MQQNAIQSFLLTAASTVQNGLNQTDRAICAFFFIFHILSLNLCSFCSLLGFLAVVSYLFFYITSTTTTTTYKLWKKKRRKIFQTMLCVYKNL